ncbi:SRPBCC family protein [Pradoshia sp. D12]|uniref:CoxG family protein n=1 Tax=Bacillaceae TaxID=186817 RepID=UPI00080AD4F8|nr:MULTISPECIES: SRPBCC family protein [Bacillaceae]OCA89892.1 carbon monoxide dehydrogenase [Bacillus sp. FJAT-27986]QFK70706.1 SRPBCC family protein [Pradoshia sp. D12]TPF72501.1 SRPBCC family protein [Bacillus sp. D12]
MPQGTHTVEVPLDIQTIWEFVHDMNKWAPLVPGYIDHEILSERQSTWAFKGDLGFMKKTVKLQIDIKEWNEPSEVIFDLKGLSDNFNGGGYFRAEVIDEKTTKMSGHLDITAGGMMGAMVNQILTKFVPQTAQELTDAIVDKLLEINTVKK